jgi:Tfp pilus assembly protein PilX
MQSVLCKKENGFMEFLARSQNGFAMVAALLSILVLTAVGLLAFAASTQDVRISSRVVAEEKAFSAAEAGIHRFLQNFDPSSLSASAVSNIQVDPANDPDSRYTVGIPSRPTSGPAAVPLPGYAIGGGQQWGQERFNVGVTGTNAKYNSLARLSVGAGFGPVEITTAYR